MTMRGKVFAISSAIWGFTRRLLQSATAEWRRFGWLPLWRPSRPAAAMPLVPPGPRWCRDTTSDSYGHYRPSRTTKCAMSSCTSVFENKTKKKEINWIRATDLELCSFFPTSRMGSVQSQARNLKMTRPLAPLLPIRAGRHRMTSHCRSGSSTIASRSTCWTADFRSLLASNAPSPFSNWIYESYKLL